MAPPQSESREARSDDVRGAGIPRRRFTRWALYYFLLYLCLPILAMALAVDAALYFVFTRFFDSCYALFCLLQ